MKRIRGLLFQTNINRLKKVAERLNYNQRMDGSQIILCEDNQKAVASAKESIDNAIRILKEVQ